MRGLALPIDLSVRMGDHPRFPALGYEIMAADGEYQYNANRRFDKSHVWVTLGT